VTWREPPELGKYRSSGNAASIEALQLGVPANADLAANTRIYPIILKTAKTSSCDDLSSTTTLGRFCMKTLICTVGGSRDPILTAVREHKPDRVIFVCSEDDEATGARGSYTEVETKNPSLPMEAGLDARTWEVVKVPADDPVAILSTLAPLMTRAMSDGRCIADYTAGTKSMSAALFMAACQRPEVRISLVTGPRTDLVRIKSGMGFGRTTRIANTAIQRERLAAQVMARWATHAYGEAARLIASEAEARDPTTDRWEILSRGFAAWDAWDHERAFELLSNFGRYVGSYLRTLRELTSPPTRSSDAHRVADMYASAERRAHNLQFDAGVLRYYRVFEWIAQWTLKWDHGVDAGDVPTSSPVAEFAYRDANTGKLVVGCNDAWKAVAKLDGPLKDTATRLGNRMRELALKRNQSVLTHGQRALGPSDLASCRSALDAEVWPAFQRAADVSVVQLPTTLP
jgi:CRISPR-associated protein (Cas_Cas02710)